MLKSFITKSIAAGIMIGIGDVIYLSCENKIVGALLFSLGLLTVIKMDLFLYTGKIGRYDEYTWQQLVLMLMMNFVGSSISIFLAMTKNGLYKQVVDLSNNKFDHPLLYYLAMGIMCGICMYIAVTCKSQIITVLAITTFILSGFEHCVADFPYFIFCRRSTFLPNLLKLGIIIIGNSIGSIWFRKLTGERSTV